MFIRKLAKSNRQNSEERDTSLDHLVGKTVSHEPMQVLPKKLIKLVDERSLEPTTQRPSVTSSKPFNVFAQRSTEHSPETINSRKVYSKPFESRPRNIKVS